MFSLLIFGAVALSACHASPTRIVNGTDAYLGEIPYIVSLQRGRRHFCGGSILDELHVLTAAHCIYGSNLDIEIQYGIIDLQSYDNIITVVKQVYHPSYQPGGGYFNDVAVLTLERPIQFSYYAQPTVLPEQGEETPEESPSVLAGWGYPYTGGSVERFLQRVDLKIYSEDECEERHGKVTNRYYHVCSGVPEGGKGQCSGDSGGPLYANGKQVGVVSWSVKPCTIKGYPGVFARVASFVDWIKNEAGM